MRYVFCWGFKSLIICLRNDLSCGVSHYTCLHWRVNSRDTLSWEYIGSTGTLCYGLFFFSLFLSTGPGVVFRFSLKAVLCYALSFFYEFIFDEMISCAKAYKVQLGGDSLKGDWNVQKVLHRLDTCILTYIFCQNMWNNTILSKIQLPVPWVAQSCSWPQSLNIVKQIQLNMMFCDLLNSNSDNN